ncbi:MAG: sulfatase-like hydrolase/transferase [Deltaproteobacteria bacterium]|nr:sulfatase-like hydrolase/transferase [Deltaproteobacteria bacterium]
MTFLAGAAKFREMVLRGLVLSLLAGLGEALAVAWRASRIAEVDSWAGLLLAAFGAGATGAMRLLPALFLLELLAAAVGRGVSRASGPRAGQWAAALTWGAGAGGVAFWVLTWYVRFDPARMAPLLGGAAVGMALLARAFGSKRAGLRRSAVALAFAVACAAVIFESRISFGQYPTFHVAVQWLALAVLAAALGAIAAFRAPLRGLGGGGLGLVAAGVLVALPLHWSLGASTADRATVHKLGWMTLPQDQLLNMGTLNPLCEAAEDVPLLPAAARAEAFLRHAHLDPLPRDLAGRNLILVVMDAVRRDRVGAYGGRGGLTPNLDALAGGSVVFENAYASSAGTIGTMGAMFCLAPPSWVEMTTEEVFWRGKLGEGCKTMAERLSERGYATSAHLHFYVAGTFPKASGFHRGFDEVTRGENDFDVVETALMALDREREGDDRPVFFWLQLGQAHEPYVAPPGFEPRDGSEESRYDAAVASIDAAVGALEAGLRSRGVWRESVVVVLADHGEEFGDHGGRHHNRTVYDEMLRVPLVVHDARLKPRRVREDVVLSDLGAWLLWQRDGRPDGEVVDRVASSAGLLYGALGGVRIAELLSNAGIRVALIDGPRKAMRNLTSRYDELYDRKADPRERRNLARADSRDSLLAALDRYEALRSCTRRAHVTPLWGDRDGRTAATAGEH